MHGEYKVKKNCLSCNGIRAYCRGKHSTFETFQWENGEKYKVLSSITRLTLSVCKYVLIIISACVFQSYFLEWDSVYFVKKNTSDKGTGQAIH